MILGAGIVALVAVIVLAAVGVMPISATELQLHWRNNYLKKTL